MQSHRERNYFSILGIGPSADFKEVKVHAKKKILECHPDKHPEAKGNMQRIKELEENVKEIIDAWRHLDTPEKLKAYYAHITCEVPIANNNHDFYFDTEQERQNPLHREGDPSGLSPNGVKLPVYVVFWIARENALPENYTREEMEKILNELRGVLWDEMQNMEYVDFNIFARRLTGYLNRDNIFVQVGIDKSEAQAILDQHSWYKPYYNKCGYFFLKINVNLFDIDMRRSEKQESKKYGLQPLNARSGEFFSIKPHTKIHVEDIVSIVNFMHHGLKQEKVFEIYNALPLNNHLFGKPRITIDLENRQEKTGNQANDLTEPCLTCEPSTSNSVSRCNENNSNFKEAVPDVDEAIREEARQLLNDIYTEITSLDKKVGLFGGVTFYGP